MPSAAKSGRTAEIQDRDLLILRGLFEARVMTAEHVAAIYFEGRYEAARKRLQKLKAAGYVGERPRRVYDPAVLFLTRKAFEVLCETGTISDLPRMSWPSLEKRVRVSELTLRHELEVQDVRAAFHLATNKTDGVEIAEFSTWPVLYQFEAFTPDGEAVTVKPDGFIRIHELSPEGETFEQMFFLEVDRSTETQNTLLTRALCYRDYYQRGGFAVRCGYSPQAFNRVPFRVLMTFKTPERLHNTAAALLAAHPPVLSQVWLTTIADVLTGPLDPIWRRPADLRPSDSEEPISSKRHALLEKSCQ
jgi:hypothetical protein